MSTTTPITKPHPIKDFIYVSAVMPTERQWAVAWRAGYELNWVDPGGCDLEEVIRRIGRPVRARLNNGITTWEYATLVCTTDAAIEARAIQDGYAAMIFNDDITSFSSKETSPLTDESQKALKAILDNHELRLMDDSKGCLADLRGANLQCVNLYGANLKYADLRGADLSGADLRGADMFSANLYNANLTGTRLAASRMSFANVRGANLSGVDLASVNLQCAYMEGANMQRVNLRGAYLRETHLKGTDLTGADLSGADLTGADLTDAIMIGADLTDAIMNTATAITINDYMSK